MLAELGTNLFPATIQLRLEAIRFDERTITLQVTSTQATAPYPACGHVARRIHSGYLRTLADLPVADLMARVHLQVRRFRCDQSTCSRTTFTERLPELVAPYARRTRRLAATQRDVGLALGGAAGARLVANQHMPTSRNTLLRLIRRMPPPVTDAPRVVGLDDWAQRKGCTYGTIVVDLETRAPIDLLDDRSAATVERWLLAHPTVEVVSRDRAEAYASGTTTGAPQAVQVADRFHILKNLCEVIAQELAQCGVRINRQEADDPEVRAGLRVKADATMPPVGVPGESGGRALVTGLDIVAGPELATLPPLLPNVGTMYADTPSGRRAENTRQARRRARFAQYTQVIALRKQGLDQATIAHVVGMSTRTISRWLAVDSFPERKPRSGEASCLDPYKPSLREHWQAGCHNGTHLWRMLQAQGFTGSYSVVADYLAPLRRGEDVRDDLDTLPAATPMAKEQFYTARQAAFLFLRRPTELTEDEQQDLAHMQAQNGILATIYTLTQEFAAMVRQRNPEPLDAWLDGAARSDFPELRRFANGVRRDYAAVRAGLELPWSQGPVEGHITRLKLLKRQMYGRAKLDLLRHRVLHVA